MHFVAELNCQEIRAGLRKMFPVVVVVKWLWRSAATYEVQVRCLVVEAIFRSRLNAKTLVYLYPNAGSSLS